MSDSGDDERCIVRDDSEEGIKNSIISGYGIGGGSFKMPDNQSSNKSQVI